MSITYANADQVPAHVDLLIDGNGALFRRDWNAIDAWYAQEGRPLRLADLFTALGQMASACVRCEAGAAASVCCSSHGKELCHGCYRASHFVEICGDNCGACAAEGLDPAKRVPA